MNSTQYNSLFSNSTSDITLAKNTRLELKMDITTKNSTHEPSLSEILKTYNNYNIATDLIKWVMPVIIITGTIGNIFSFIIMIRREMRQTPTFFYLAMLAIADTAVLYVSAFKTWLRIISGYELSHINAFSCKLTMFLVHFSIEFSAWLIVAVTIERFLAVWFPLKASTMCNLSRAKFITLIVAVIFMLVNSHIFWTAELLPIKQTMDDSNFICASYAYENFVCRIFPKINLVLYSFLPCLILVIFNILIIICLMRTKHVPNMITKDDCLVRTTHRKLAITLILISLTWIITTTPRPLFRMFAPQPKSNEDRANILMWQVICFQLMYVNHAVNFFLYCLSGEKFRIQFKKFICKLCQRRKQPKTRLTFKSSRSGSTGQYSSIPLVASTPTAIEISVFD